jgi:hypothetical protein
MPLALRAMLVASFATASAVSVAAQASTSLPLEAAGRADDVWSRVRATDPGTEIVVTAGGLPSRVRILVAADDRVVTVVQVADALLPSSAQDALQRLAVEHPERLLAAQRGARFVLNQTVSLGPDGLFVGDRRVAQLGQLTENIARGEVATITRRHKGRGFWGRVGLLGGYFVGALGGGYAAGLTCRAVNGGDRCDTGAFLKGAMVGGFAGASYGFRAARRETEEVIYRAP